MGGKLGKSWQMSRMFDNESCRKTAQNFASTSVNVTRICWVDGAVSNGLLNCVKLVS